MQLLTVFWIFSVIELSTTLTVNICSTDSAHKHINCTDREEALITIQEATAVYNQPLRCGPGVIGLGGNPSARCRNKQKNIFRRCYGRTSCEVKPADAILQLSGGCGSSATNFLLVEYFCLLVDNYSEARLPISGVATADSVHIFSPRFPNAMLPREYSFSCTISPIVSPGEEVTLTVGKNVLIMNATSNNGCAERLEIYAMLPGTTDCNPQEIWGEEVTLKVRGSVTMTYSKRPAFSYGGRFWLQLRAVSASNTRVQLKIECSDQDQIPGDDNNRSTLTTSTTSTQTSSLTSETSTDRPRTTSQGTTSEDPPNTETTTDGKVTTGVSTTEGSLGTVTTAVTTMATVSTSTNVESEVVRPGPEMSEDESKDSMLYGIIGGIAGVVLIIVAVIIIIVLLRSRRKNREDDNKEAVKYDNQNGVLYSEIDSTGKQPDFGNLETKPATTENEYECDGDAMYSTVNESTNEEPVKNLKVCDPTEGDGTYDTAYEHKTASRSGYVNSGAVNSAYDEVGEDVNEKETEDGETYAEVNKTTRLGNEDGIKNENAEEMYAEVDKTLKRRKTVQSGLDDDDDTVMCENEDLYDTL